MTAEPVSLIRRVWHGLQDLTGPRAPALARVRRGVLYGLWVGALFGLAAGTIDYFTIHDLPLRIEWPALAGRMAFAALAMAALMAVTAWPRTFWRGTLTAAAVVALTVIVVAMVEAARQLQGSVIVLFFLLPTYSVLSLPFAGILRWVLQQHESSLSYPAVQRWLTQIGLVLLVGLVSAWAGTWFKMSEEAHRAARRVQILVDEALTKTSDADLPYVLKDYPAFLAHAGVPYYLTQQPDRYSLEGFDVTVRFDDGYRLTCLALLRPSPTVTRCVEGETLYP